MNEHLVPTRETCEKLWEKGITKGMVTLFAWVREKDMSGVWHDWKLSPAQVLDLSDYAWESDTRPAPLADELLAGMPARICIDPELAKEEDVGARASAVLVFTAEHGWTYAPFGMPTFHADTAAQALADLALWLVSAGYWKP